MRRSACVLFLLKCMASSLHAVTDVGLCAGDRSQSVQYSTLAVSLLSITICSQHNLSDHNTPISMGRNYDIFGSSFSSPATSQLTCFLSLRICLFWACFGRGEWHLIVHCFSVWFQSTILVSSSSVRVQHIPFFTWLLLDCTLTF